MVWKTHKKAVPIAPQPSEDVSGPPEAEPPATPNPKVKKRAQDFRDTEDLPEKKVFILPKAVRSSLQLHVNPQRQQHNPAPQCSLPKRHGRKEDPVSKRAKATRAAAKKADKVAKAASKQKKEADTEATKETLADVEADESFVQQHKREHRIHRQSDMGVSGGNNMDKQEEEFADLMDMDFSTDVESGSNAKVHSHHYKLSLQEYKTHRYKQTKHTKGTKTQPKLQDQVAEKKKGKEMGGKKQAAFDLIRWLMVNVLHNNGLPTASGLNIAWLAASRSKKQGATEVEKHMLDDEAALSTRPDFPRSPDKFDHEAANAALLKASKRNLTRQNAVC
jgi:hypothetical protein